MSYFWSKFVANCVQMCALFWKMQVGVLLHSENITEKND